MISGVRRMRAALRTLALALMGYGLAHCGGEDDANTVRVSRNIGGRDGFRVHWDVWKATYEKMNPGWKMELIDVGEGDIGAYYRRSIGTGDLPHVVMTVDLTRPLADGGHLLPIPRELYEKVGQRLPPLHNGEYYTAQIGRQILGIAVNRRMWADAGITEPPQSWDAFVDGLRRVRDAGYDPFTYGASGSSASELLNYALQIDLYDPNRHADEPSWTVRRDRGEITFATDPTARLILERVIDFVDEFVHEGVLGDGYNEQQRDFFGGHAATWMMGCWMSGDVEPLQVEFEIEYWPIPSMTGHPPRLINTSNQQRGWSMTTSAKGEYYDKSLAVLEAYYHPDVYQAYLNAEGMLVNAAVPGVDGPKSDWPATKYLHDSMTRNVERWGVTPGFFISIVDYPPTGFGRTQGRVMQEIIVGNRDVDALLEMLDRDWEAGRKASK